VQSVLLAVAALACPVGMGTMMWLMMRGQRRGGNAEGQQPGEQEQQVAALRAEIEQLKADRAQRTHGGQ